MAIMQVIISLGVVNHATLLGHWILEIQLVHVWTSMYMYTLDIKEVEDNGSNLDSIWRYQEKEIQSWIIGLKRQMRENLLYSSGVIVNVQLWFMVDAY